MSVLDWRSEWHKSRGGARVQTGGPERPSWRDFGFWILDFGTRGNEQHAPVILAAQRNAVTQRNALVLWCAVGATCRYDQHPTSPYTTMAREPTYQDYVERYVCPPPPRLGFCFHSLTYCTAIGRIHYSEKYSDDKWEYRYVGRQLWAVVMVY